MDLKSFINEIPRGLILKLIRRKMADEKFVTLNARFLKAGVIAEGKIEKMAKGCSIFLRLSNIVLNELDHKLGEKNLGYCSWVDWYSCMTLQSLSPEPDGFGH